MKNASPKWGWTSGGTRIDRHIRGPFKTRAAALKDAEKCGVKRVILGHIIYPKPENCFGLEVSTAIDDADDVVYAEYRFRGDDRGGGSFFELKKGVVGPKDQGAEAKAQKELDDFLAKWAKKWIVPIGEIFVDEEEL